MAAIIPSLLPILASTMGAPTPECVALSEASNLLRTGDEGLRHKLAHHYHQRDYAYGYHPVNGYPEPGHFIPYSARGDRYSDHCCTDNKFCLPSTPSTSGWWRLSSSFSRRPTWINEILDHPKATSTDYPHSTEVRQEPFRKSRSKWLHMLSNVNHPKPSSKFFHHQPSSTCKHVSSPTPALSHSVESRSPSKASGSSSKIDFSSDSASPTSPSSTPAPSMATPSPTPSSSLELSSESSSPVISPTLSSSASPPSTPGPSCATAPGAVVYLACDLVFIACSCLRMTSATFTSTVTSISILSSLLDTLNTIFITVQDITTITVSSVFDTTTPTGTATTASISTTTVCPCAASRPSLCSTTAEECAKDDADDCGTCGKVCPNGAGCNDELCNQFRFMPRIR